MESDRQLNRWLSPFYSFSPVVINTFNRLVTAYTLQPGIS